MLGAGLLGRPYVAAGGNGLDGILLVDKPQGFTSFDVVAKLRGICGTRKIGHGGTLDPMATGVLPVFVGGAVKAVDLQPCQDKTYEASMLLGKATDTGDITGSVLKEQPVTAGEEELLQVLPRFEGVQLQTPPMYSAVKIDGKPLYKYAREGKTVERKAREITVFSIRYLGRDEAPHCYRIQVCCSKGTYIRTLVEDIGAALGLPATLAALQRTRAGVFDAEETHTLVNIQQAKDAGRLDELFVPVSRVFSSLPKIAIDEVSLQRLLNGAPCRSTLAQSKAEYAAWVGDKFIGLVQSEGDGVLRGKKLFVRKEETTGGN